MPLPPNDAPDAPPPRLPPVRGSARSRWIGSIVALALLAGLAALAWWLLNRPAVPQPGAASQAAGARAGGPPASGAARGGNAEGGGGAGPGGAGGGGGGRGGPPTTVGVAVATRADLPVWLDALGTVTPAVTVTVRPQVSGVLTAVRYTEGQTVRKGELLATIDPRPFEIALQQAVGARLRDEADLENARVTLDRYKTLLAQDSIARQDVDTAQATVRRLEATIVVDRANEATARLNLGYSRIVAPVAGRVGLRTVDVGNVVSTGDAAGIAVLTQVAPIDVEFSVPQDRVPEIEARVATRAPMPVSALDRTRSAVLDTGTFSTLDNQIDTTTGTVRAKARFANAKQALFPNQFVNVRVLLDTRQGATVVPVTAVRRGAQGDFVYVIRDDRTVEQRPVQRGLADDRQVQIERGVAVGERVVTEGGDRLRDGARVQLPEPAASAASGASGASGPRGERRRGTRPEA